MSTNTINDAFDSVQEKTTRPLEVDQQGRIWRWDIEQGTDEWLIERMGRITASPAKVLTTSGLTKTGKQAKGSGGQYGDEFEELGAGAVTYAKKLAIQRHSSTSPKDNVKSPFTQWGHDNEPLARAALCKAAGVTIDEIGIVVNGWHACSPDGISESGKFGAEIKCFNEDKHATYIFDGVQVLVDEVYTQVQWSMLVTGYSSWYVAAFHPNQIEENQLRYQLVDRDDVFIRELSRKAAMLENLVQHLSSKLQNN